VRVSSPAVRPVPPLPDHPSDESITRRLVRDAQSGVASAMTPLYERLAPALYGWAVLRIPREVRGRLEPDDLMQDVWVRALGAYGSYDPDRGPFRPWLFQVAKYTLLDALRRLRVRPAPRQEPEEGEDGARLSQLADEATAVSRQVARRDDVGAFLRRVAALPDDEQALVVHHGMEGLSLGEAAERLGIGKAAAQKRWQRLRARLVEEGLPAGMVD
jgi:RNA polymerase sigma factor (sigma-70 family)